MNIEPELKPLLACFKRIHLGEFLYTKHFELFLLERNLDQLWNSSKKEATKDKALNLITEHDTEEEEDALGIMINRLYLDGFDHLGVFIVTVILEFATWAKTKVDLNQCYEAIKQLDLLEKRQLKEFLETLRSIRDSKPEKIEAKVNLPQEETIDNKKVFIVHGHDDKSRLELCEMIKTEFGLEPIVLQEQPNESLDTIISKFERLAEGCGMAMVLMTADDVSDKFTRARQNVIFELGYFLGKLRNKNERKIIVIKNGDVEIPSDISGVLYLVFHRSVEELYLPLKKQLKHWQMIK